MRFGHIGIRVIKPEASVKFYTELLGCSIIEDHNHPGMRVIFLEAHGTVIELICKDANEERSYGPVEHIAFKVDSLNDEMERLAASGITFTDPKTVGNSRLIFFDGPNNERIEFAEEIN